MEKLLQSIKDKWPIILSLCVSATLVFFAYGCQPKTESLISPDKKVTAGELQSEIDFLMSRAEIRFLDLTEQQKLRDFVLNQSIIIAESGTINPVGLLTSLFAILGVGATVDDVRLRKQRKKTLTYEPQNGKT